MSQKEGQSFSRRFENVNSTESPTAPCWGSEDSFRSAIWYIYHREPPSNSRSTSITTRQNMSKGYLWRELATEVSNVGNDRVMEFKRYARERRVIEITRTTIRRRSRRHARATEQSQLGRSSSVTSPVHEFSDFSQVGTSDFPMLPTEALERVPEVKWTMAPPQGWEKAIWWWWGSYETTRILDNNRKITTR